MLMHHAYAMRNGLAAGADAHALAIDFNFATIGFIKAVKNGHQRRFSGTIFTNNAMNGAPLHPQMHIFIGFDGTKGLIDAGQFNSRAGLFIHQRGTGSLG